MGAARAAGVPIWATDVAVEGVRLPMSDQHLDPVVSIDTETSSSRSATTSRCQRRRSIVAMVTAIDDAGCCISRCADNRRIAATISKRRLAAPLDPGSPRPTLVRVNSGTADGRPSLYELFDDAGRAWLDELVRLFNDGAYTEAVDRFLADEAAFAIEGGP